MTPDDVLIEALKEFAYEHELTRVTGTYRSARDEWTTVEVKHAGAYDDAPDGWTVEVRVTSL